MLQKLIDFTLSTGIERLKEKHGGSLPASITLDLDATDDPTHGNQQLTLFHGYYGQCQYFPLIISEAATRPVFVAWLRPGAVHASLGADDDLMRVVNALRKERPDIAIHVRGDAGFGLPRMDELKNGPHLDRLSGHRFMANFFRLLLHAAAYHLLNAARGHPELPELLRAGQPCTWRTHLIKVAAEVVQTTRRVIVRLAAQWPWWPIYQAAARRAVNFLSTA